MKQVLFSHSNRMMSYCKTVLMLALPILCSANLYAQNRDQGSQTLSPYFAVLSDNPETDQLPLKKTHADVNIVGVIADVTITQEYKNEGEFALEAIYTFPASSNAAVYAMEMTIGNRKIVAKIEENDDYGTVASNGKINWGKPIQPNLEKHRGLGDTDAPLWMVYTLIILLSVVWFHYFYVIYQIIRIKMEEKKLIT